MNRQVRTLIAVLFAATVLVTGFVLFNSPDHAGSQGYTAPSTSSEAAASSSPIESTPAQETAPAAESPSEAPAPQDSPEVPEPSDAPPVPPATVPFLGQVDNQPFDVPNPQIQCTAEANFKQVTATSQDAAAGTFAAVQMDDSNQVISVSLGDGQSATGLIVESATNQGQATVEQLTDKTYRVYGQALEIDYSTMGENTTKPFSFDITCP